MGARVQVILEMVCMVMPTQLTPHLNLWLEQDGQVVLSRWRVQLLEAIEESGSISGAAARMGVQYRLAWDRLDEMENGLGVRLVERHVGGPGGGGARLTDAGRSYVARFNLFAAGVDATVAEQFTDTFGQP
jgi:molybdate transport system regulatory protein